MNQSFSRPTLVLLGGYVLERFGVPALALGASVLTLIPIVFVLLSSHARPVGEAA